MRQYHENSNPKVSLTENFEKVSKEENKLIDQLYKEGSKLSEDEKKTGEADRKPEDIGSLADITGLYALQDYINRSPGDKLRDKARKADSRIREMYGKGQAEAIALNNEYSRLLAQLQRAQEAVKDFEVDKLGMTEES